MLRRHAVSALSLCALAGLNLSCASAPPPPELVEARAAYASASSGSASQLAPVELDNAHRALAEAETAYLDHGDASMTRDLAYIAERRSQQAAAYGNIAASQRLLAERQTASQRQTVADLASTRQQLVSEQQQVAVGQQALSQEQQARAEADRTAAAALESLRRVASVREESRGMVITLSGEVLFASGQTVLLPIAQQRLQQVAAMLRDRRGQNIMVDGFTDSRGSASANQALSLARAQAVRDYLVSNGVPADQVRAEGLGPDRPVADNSTPEGRADNRRVEIVVAPPATGMGGGPGARPIQPAQGQVPQP